MSKIQSISGDNWMVSVGDSPTNTFWVNRIEEIQVEGQMSYVAAWDIYIVPLLGGKEQKWKTIRTQDVTITYELNLGEQF